MKKVLVLALCALFLVPLKAVDYCASSSWGYAGTSVTGGGNATPTFVTNESELSAALNKKNSVIIITQNITVTNHISSDKSNLTIMALPGKKLISNKQNASNSGILYLKGSNIIIRNIIFEGPGAFDCDGWDNLCLDKATNVWVDHCDFQDGCDGNFDIKGTADNITVTWCRFRYLKTPRPRDAGDTNPDHTDDHRFSNLVGSGSSDKPTDGTYNITYGFCWWDEGCKQRMTRCRNCLIHYLNCYWNSSVADYYIGPEKASCYFEGCTFAGKANSPSKIWNVFNHTTNYCKFVNCTGNLPSDAGSVSAPTYAYDQLSAATAKNYVTNSTCGAGATLTITTAAEVSSACDGGDVPPVGPVSGECCIDLSLGEAPTVANEGIPADFSQLNFTYSLNHTSSLWLQGYLNLGSNNDYITFDFSAYNAVIESVTFDVTIPNWEGSNKNISYHWNNDDNTAYPIASNVTEIVSLTAPENAKSFTIKRSASKGTQISQVCFQITALTPSDTEALTSIQNQSAARKVLRNGQVLIFRDGKTYNLLGQSL